MKIESFEIKHGQYLEVVFNKGIICYNLKKISQVVEISIDKRAVWFHTRPEKLEADFDLTPIIEAWELANLEK